MLNGVKVCWKCKMHDLVWKLLGILHRYSGCNYWMRLINYDWYICMRPDHDIVAKEEIIKFCMIRGVDAKLKEFFGLSWCNGRFFGNYIVRMCKVLKLGVNHMCSDFPLDSRNYLLCWLMSCFFCCLDLFNMPLPNI